MIPANELIKTDAEIKKMEADDAQKPPTPDPEMEKLVNALRIEQMKGRTAMMLEGARRETALITMASEQNWSRQELAAEIQKSREEIASKERIFAAEAAVESRKDARGDTGGSGGYIS